MRTWQRAAADLACGLCTARIVVGDPVLRISLPTLTRPLWRCDRCVGPAPPDLPAVIAHRAPPPSSGFSPLRDVARTAVLDFKARAAGDA